MVYSVKCLPGVGDSVTSNRIGVYLDRGVADVTAELILRRGDTFDLGGDLGWAKVAHIDLNTEEGRAALASLQRDGLLRWPDAHDLIDQDER